MHEMGMGVTGINPHNGTVRNPYNDKHVTGGSSSGSAAAVASGLVPFAIGSVQYKSVFKNAICKANCGSVIRVRCVLSLTGTDGGGSVRIPSAFCGVQGLKPTFGLYSCVGTGISKSTVASAGVIANNVADVALVSKGPVSYPEM